MERGIAGFKSAQVCRFNPDKFEDKDVLLAQELGPVAIENEVENQY